MGLLNSRYKMMLKSNHLFARYLRDQFIAFDLFKVYILVNNLCDKLANRPGSVCIGQSKDIGWLYRQVRCRRILGSSY